MSLNGSIKKNDENEEDKNEKIINVMEDPKINDD